MIETINIFLFPKAIWGVYICTVVNAVLSQCNVAAANICRAKKKNLYLSLAKSRNKMSKRTLEGETASHAALFYYCGAVVLASRLSFVSYLE